jgi:hypothetical protein
LVHKNARKVENKNIKNPPQIFSQPSKEFIQGGNE